MSHSARDSAGIKFPNDEPSAIDGQGMPASAKQLYCRRKAAQNAPTSKRFSNTISGSMQIRIILLIALLMMSSPAAAWIAYGFKSGMSRFEATGQLSDKPSMVITEAAQQTFAGPDDDQTKYTLVYCSSPQKLYLMKFGLAGSRADFVKTKQKYEKRYGKPEGLDDWESANWEDADVSLIWDLNESETILLTHSRNGTSAEFQDLSVCQ